jgi:Zn-dependent protease with chaperone function
VNFFEHQDRARQSTRLLVVLFFAAIFSLVVITTFLVAAAIAVSEQNLEPGMTPDFVGSDIFISVSFLVVSVVLLGTLYRHTQLRGGGRVVAESLGGRLLNSSTGNADERKILNVVEEMAIASGVPVPQVYLLEDSAINAFAAGYTPQDAVIGITRGCIELLDRDELQGVVAHEFSHIFNGDMRLNIRLIGWLYGITVIGLIGYHLMRSGAYRNMRSSRDNRGGLAMLGIGLIIVGYGGTFFGSLIKAAVSRQREFLADASAVQFTRNPGGIGNALKKIGGWSEGSMLRTAGASEVSHMLFGQGVKAGITGLMATHPPLAERIRRIEPGWKGDFIRPVHQPASSPASPAGASAFSGPVAAATVLDNVGEPSPGHIETARHQLAAIPQAIAEEAHTALGACLLMHSVVIANADEAVAREQLAFLRSVLKPVTFRQLEALASKVAVLPTALVLPLIEISLPALRQLSVQQSRIFLQHLHSLMQADGSISLFEWSMFRIIRHNLDETRVAQKRGLRQCRQECAILLSAVASAGHDNPEAAKAAFDAAAKVLAIGSGRLEFSWHANPVLAELEQSLNVLRELMPLQKPRLLKAIVTCIEEDGAITADESVLLRTIGAILDCPIPPLN